MDVSVIIVNFNSAALSIACINSIFHFTRDVAIEVIVVDNASIGQSATEIKLAHPRIKLITNEENKGFGYANNKGIRHAKGKYIFLLNPDTLLTSNALYTFFTYMELETSKNVACCGASLITLDGSKQVSYGNFPSLFEELSKFGPGLFYKRYYKRKISTGVKVYRSTIHAVDYISGASLFIRASVLNEIGIFDEDFFLYFEETELAYRMKKRGYLSMIMPDVNIIHIEGGTHTEQQRLMKQKVYAESQVLFFKKCYGTLAAFLIKWIQKLK